MKYFRMSYEEVVFNRSYLNIMLLNRSIPSWDNDKEDDENNAGRDNETTRKHDKTKRAIQRNVHASEFFMNMM